MDAGRDGVTWTCCSWAHDQLSSLATDAPAARIVPSGTEQLLHAYITEQCWPVDLRQKARLEFPSLFGACDYAATSADAPDGVMRVLSEVLKRLLQVCLAALACSIPYRKARTL
jgi:hypothetical protein